MEAWQGEQRDAESPYFTPDRDPDLLTDNNWEEYLTYGVPMYQAALSGNWEAASEILNQYPLCKFAKITKQGDTALHVAVTAKQTSFVRNLVASIEEEDLGLPNNVGNSALCLAAATGSVRIAKMLVNKNDRLPMIRGINNWTSLQMAAMLGHKEMVSYLWPLTRDVLSHEELVALLSYTIDLDLYDVALNILKLKPKDVAFRILTWYNKVNDAQVKPSESPLHVLARKSMKSCGNELSCWRRFCVIFDSKSGSRNKENTCETSALELLRCLWKSLLSQSSEAKISNLLRAPPRLLFVAVQAGNVEFLTTVIRSYPDLIWKFDQNGRSLFHVAILHRQENIFQLIYEVGGVKDVLAQYVDNEGNNMLHLAAMLPSSDRLNCISGAALQMQREMLWFKVVESLVKPETAKAPNKAGKTARTLFTAQHRELRKAGENWMRNTASSCSVVATLIASVVFGAVLKIPIANGLSPNPLNQGLQYWVFAISDSLSLISATASILMFLSILTSRYAEKDFLISLPRKLMFGLTLLFISIATMMIAFTAIFSIVFNHGLLWVATGILAFVPIILFAFQIFGPFVDYRSFIGCKFISKPHCNLF